MGLQSLRTVKISGDELKDLIGIKLQSMSRAVTSSVESANAISSGTFYNLNFFFLADHSLVFFCFFFLESEFQLLFF